MHEFKQGQLKSGGSGKKVTNPKQAVAIGLSEARKSGASVPPAKKKGAVKKTATKKTATKKAAVKKAAPAKKKAAAKKK
ncbi:MAG: putative histone H1-like protein [Bryobacterales bacterium]|nr:putative histone H1-like protein [Bryobacterales bacterium]